jgi:hypothetical protein
MDPNRKQILFKMWSQLGPSLESFKYLGISGESQYKLLLAEFLGLPGNTSEKKLMSLEKHIKDTCNEFLSLPENSPCNGTLRMIGNDALASASLLGQPGKRFNQLKGLFAYRIPEDFVCEDLETYSDIEEMYRVDECFTDDCVRDSLNKLKSYIKKVYGDLILNNIELYSEDNVIGDIPLKKYS